MKYKRWNFDADDDNVYACRGDHDKDQECVMEPISPHEVLKIINELRAECLRLTPTDPQVEELANRVRELDEQVKILDSSETRNGDDIYNSFKRRSELLKNGQGPEQNISDPAE